MVKNEIFRIINEEVGKFNYLNNDSIKEEANEDELLNSKEFQTRLIHDIINGVVKFKDEYGVIDDVDDNGWGDDVIPRLEKQYSFVYNYNGRPFNLGLDLQGTNLPVTSSGQNIKGNYYTQDEYPTPESVDYSNMEVFFWNEGTEIKMPWFEKNYKLKDKFVRSILGDMPE